MKVGVIGAGYWGKKHVDEYSALGHEIFVSDLSDDSLEFCRLNYDTQTTNDYHDILNDNGYKRNILYNSHPDLYKSNSWEGIRQWCMARGVRDTPTSKYTKLWIPEENKDSVREIIQDGGSVDYKGDPLDESKRDPKWAENFTSNKFF